MGTSAPSCMRVQANRSRARSASAGTLGGTVRPMADARPRLFSPLFFVMCGFSFTVFVSAFMLLPTAPFHILDLGGTTTQAGLFLGMLTFASALSAPLTGALADRVGRRRMLITSSLVITV